MTVSFSLLSFAIIGKIYSSKLHPVSSNHDHCYKNDAVCSFTDLSLNLGEALEHVEHK
jgi:hypothetical protein